MYKKIYPLKKNTKYSSLYLKMFFQGQIRIEEFPAFLPESPDVFWHIGDHDFQFFHFRDTFSVFRNQPLGTYLVQSIVTQWARKFNKVQAKKTSEIK